MTLADLATLICDAGKGAQGKPMRIVLPEEDFCVLVYYASSHCQQAMMIDSGWQMRVFDRFWFYGVEIVPGEVTFPKVEYA